MTQCRVWGWGFLHLQSHLWRCLQRGQPCFEHAGPPGVLSLNELPPETINCKLRPLIPRRVHRAALSERVPTHRR